MSLLGELDTPHALYDTARAAAERQARNVEQAEQLRRSHDRRIGARTRMVAAAGFGGTFCVVPLLLAMFPSLRDTGHAGHVVTNSLDARTTLYASSAANAVFTTIAIWRWRPSTLPRADSSPTA
jgi:hypothetical protein